MKSFRFIIFTLALTGLQPVLVMPGCITPASNTPSCRRSGEGSCSISERYGNIGIKPSSQTSGRFPCRKKYEDVPPNWKKYQLERNSRDEAADLGRDLRSSG